ncbi:MAG: stage IV sporulation protein A, partial [Firmicutes bacterium]|nr:stage IV sporulation protein A [Bacillota bacterium]
LHEMLYEFPVREVSIRVSEWIDELPADYWVREEYDKAVYSILHEIERLRDIDVAVQRLAEYEFVDRVTLSSMDLGTGTALIDLEAPKNLFYKVMEELTGFEVTGDHHLLRLMKELTQAKREYDKVAAALASVRARGYGIVNPGTDDIAFDEPELFRHGRNFGVRLKASAPSIHLVRAQIETEVTPFVGTEKQGEELVRYLSDEYEKDPAKVWHSDFLGKPLQELVREGINSKLHRMPDTAQIKLQETLTRIINEGSGGLICIIL